VAQGTLSHHIERFYTCNSTAIERDGEELAEFWEWVTNNALRSDTDMTHAIIRGKNGRRHEVDFGESPVRVEVYASDETIEIFVEADFETLSEERRRFALINIPRQQFSQATGKTARRAARKDR
jgi:hypothetical protein